MCPTIVRVSSMLVQLDLRTNFEWKQDAPSSIVQRAAVWKSTRGPSGGAQV